jgi:kinesin family protein 15
MIAYVFIYFQKEVSRLRSLVNGGAENLDSDTSSLSFLGSPGSFKWEGFHGSSSPLMSENRMSQVPVACS